ncbi:hypothetical protein NCU05571 [Neurospora crassa OR74A]|uniref:Uncharacterized protein n=1 Tax=Neurospora crassa (strain ATCC 24698 / 74-OR23-1A / CBS 708.71 / DSM 1257 / FGSC 987) TaxID=367110 RepID=Q7S6Z2_NEUCR|nr:hypothetical protein NCU05571 [Neurospora crassa OR74A]EAA31297.1 hypothetical protein NCU05571 [Neurospora crassa OR74A]|eukprot:XP_960533.1 hypothetical protein NCU05571 [Neurospora crassa OR74A]
MSEMHPDSPAILHRAVKDIICNLEKQLKVQQDTLRVLYKEWNFWEAAGALLDFDLLEVSDFKMTEFARQVFSQQGLGFDTPSIPTPIPSVNLFPLSAEYSHPSPPPKSYGQQMAQRRQDDFRYYLEHPEMLAVMPGQVSPTVTNMNNASVLDPQLTLLQSRMPLAPPQNPPFSYHNPVSRPPAPSPTRRTSVKIVHPPSTSTTPEVRTNNLPPQNDLFFLRRMTAYRNSRYGSQKGIHPTDGKRNYEFDPHFWEKKENWDGTDDFWFKPSTQKRRRMDDEDETLSPCSVLRKRVKSAGGV